MDLPIKFVDTDPDKVIVLARTADEPFPRYCIRGKTRCYHCQEWCWLGTETFDVVSDGLATPLCMPCATKFIKGPEGFVGHYQDAEHDHL